MTETPETEEENDLILEIEETPEIETTEVTEVLPEEEILPRTPSTLVACITALMRRIFDESSKSSEQSSMSQ